jgi:hypothetical protein
MPVRFEAAKAFRRALLAGKRALAYAVWSVFLLLVLVIPVPLVWMPRALRRDRRNLPAEVQRKR